MQVQLRQRYDLRSSRKRSRELEEQKGTSPQDVRLVPDKGKGNLNHESSKIKVSSNKESNSFEEYVEKKAPFLLKTSNGKEGEVKLGGIEKFQTTFNLHKDLQKVKIHVPLIELLTQPTYKSKVSQFMYPSTSVPTHAV